MALTFLTFNLLAGRDQGQRRICPKTAVHTSSLSGGYICLLRWVKRVDKACYRVNSAGASTESLSAPSVNVKAVATGSVSPITHVESVICHTARQAALGPAAVHLYQEPSASATCEAAYIRSKGQNFPDYINTTTRQKKQEVTNSSWRGDRDDKECWRWRRSLCNVIFMRKSQKCACKLVK